MFDLFGDSLVRYVPGLVTSIASSAFFTFPFVLYVLARWRQAREAAPDPQLGVKVAVGYFALAGLQTELAGAALVLYSLVTKSEDHGDMFRAGAALVVPGAIVHVAHRLVLARTNQDGFPGVRRLLAGTNLVLCSALGFTALVFAMQALFAKGSSGEAGRFVVSAAVVYLPAWAFSAWRVFGDRLGMSMGPPLAPVVTAVTREIEAAPVVATGTATGTTTMTTMTTTTTTAATQAPGLPALGGGEFPPIQR